MAAIHIKGYALVSTRYYQGEPSQYKWDNGSIELIVWLSKNRWKYFVRKIAYMRPLESSDKIVMQKMDTIGREAINQLNRNEKHRITDSN